MVSSTRICEDVASVSRLSPVSRNEKIYVAIVYGFRSNCLRYQDPH